MAGSELYGCLSGLEVTGLGDFLERGMQRCELMILVIPLSKIFSQK